MKVTCCSNCNANYSLGPITGRTRQFASSSKCPKILRCGHTFCESCLTQMSKKLQRYHDLEHDDLNGDAPKYKANITCPECKIITSLKKDVGDLQTDLYVIACIASNHYTKQEEELNNFAPTPSKKLLQKALQDVSKEDTEKKCSMCQDRKPSCECKECENVLCKKCFEMAHRVSAAIRHHTPIPILDENETLQKIETLCKEHNRRIEYYCFQDDIPICAKCIINGIHKSHDIKSFEELNQPIIEQIQEELPTVATVLSHLKRIDRKILSVMPSYKNESKTTIANINASFAYLHALLQSREIEIIESVSKTYYDGLNALEEKRLFYEQTKNKLEKSLKEAKRLVDDNALVIDAKNILEELTKAKEIPCILNGGDLVDSKCLDWQEFGATDIISSISSFGIVDGSFKEKTTFKTSESVDLVPDDDTASVSSLSSGLSSLEFPKSEASSRAPSVITDNSSDVVVDDDTDGDNCTTSTRSSKSNLSRTNKEPITLPCVKGPPQEVMIVHLHSPSSFYVQLTRNKKKLESLSHNMNIWCRSPSSSKHIPLTLERHMLVLAKFSADKRWYRARVLSVDEIKDGGNTKFKIHVAYIDFGNDEIVDFKDLRIMQDRYMLYPEFKVHCSLYDIAPVDENSPWDIDTIQEFNELTNEKILSMNTIAKGMDGFEVDLRYVPKEDVCDDQFVSVRDVLIFRELARLKHHSNQAKYQPEIPSFSKENYISSTKVRSGTVLDCDITRASSPWDFHLTVRGEEQEYYRHMMIQMQLLYNGDMSKLYLLYYPRCGVLCVALSRDGTWYRGTVLTTPVKKQVEVLLVDTGEVITVHYDSLRKLCNEFVKLPVRAIPCRLADVGPCSKEWNDEAKLWSAQALPMSCGKARFVSWGPPTQVVLWLGLNKDPQRDASINALLPLANMAISTGPASLAVGVVCQESLPSSPQRSGLGTRRMRGSPSTSSSSSTVTSPSKRSSLPNTPVSSPTQAAETIAVPKYSASRMKAKTELDFNQEESVPPFLRHRRDHSEGLDETRALINVTVTRKKRPPLLSKKLSLKTEDHRRRSEELVKRRQEEEKEESLQQTQHSKLQVDIHRAISGEDSSPGGTAHSNPYIQILMTFFASPSDFRIRVINDNESQLKQLMQALQVVCKQGQETPAIWNIEDACAIRNPEDRQWYRGELRKLIDTGRAEVELIDYGFNIEVDTATDLKVLSDDFKKTAGAAIRCFLTDLVPAGSSDGRKWSSTACDFMKGQILEKNLYVKLMGDQSEWGWPIDVIVEEVIPETAFDPASRSYHSLRQLILDEGLAMPSKQPSPQPSHDGSNPFMRTLFDEGCERPTIVPEEIKSVINQPTEQIIPSELKHHDLEPDQDVLITPKTCAAPVILPPIPSPPPGSQMKVIPTYVDHQGIIYCQPVAWEEVILHLSEELQRVYQDAVYTPILWEKGQLCVAKFPDDDLWYRAAILEVKSSAIKVQYIDYGNTAWVTRQLVVEMSPAFGEQHLVAYCSVLEDAEPTSGDGMWPTPILNHLHELVVNHECIITVNNVSPKLIWMTLVNSSGIQFPQYLFDQKLAVDTGDLTELYTKSKAIGRVWAHLPYPTLDVDELCPEFLGQVTNVELPNLIYLQRIRIPESKAVDIVSAGEVAEMNNQITAFEQMAAQLNVCKSMPLMSLPDVSMKCAGKFSFDNCWYRAVCAERYAARDTCLLVYVDYGNSEEVGLANMRTLPTEFWSFPAQSIRCYFNISPPLHHGGVFRQSTMKGVIEQLVTKELEARVTQRSPVTVDLFQENAAGDLHLAYETLITSGLALLPAKVEATKLMAAMMGEQAPEDDPSNIMGEVEEEAEEAGGVKDYFDEIADGVSGIALATVADHPTEVTQERGDGDKDSNKTVGTAHKVDVEAVKESHNWLELYDDDGNIDNGCKKEELQEEFSEVD